MEIGALHRLKYVIAAAECGSMRRVAQLLGVKESSVSRNVAALERQLDLQIFDRSTNGVRLTDQGRDWLGSIRAQYEYLQETLEQTARRNRDANCIRIGLASPVGRDFLIRLLRRFKKTYPAFVTSIEDVPQEECGIAIRQRKLDIVFASVSDVMRFCQTETIGEERLSVLLPAGHPLETRPTLTWSDLAGENLLVPIGREGLLFDSGLLDSAAIDGLTIRRSHASQATVILAVQLGTGITLAGEGFAKTVTVDAAVWRPLTGRNSASTMKAIWLDSNPKRAVLRMIGMARNLAKS
jgi:DNA-binding transcriptional LysR family regulator